MNTSTKQLLTIAGVGALVISVATGVLAVGNYGPGFGHGFGGHHGMMNGPMGYGPGHPGMMMGGNRALYSEQQLTQLKSTLTIAPEQEQAWNEYVSAVKGKIGLMQAHQQIRVNDQTSFFKQHQSLHEQGWAQMQKVIAARENLNKLLTPEQKARTPQLSGFNCF